MRWSHYLCTVFIIHLHLVVCVCSQWLTGDHSEEASYINTIIVSINRDLLDKEGKTICRPTNGNKLGSSSASKKCKQFIHRLWVASEVCTPSFDIIRLLLLFGKKAILPPMDSTWLWYSPLRRTIWLLECNKLSSTCVDDCPDNTEYVQTQLLTTLLVQCLLGGIKKYVSSEAYSTCINNIDENDDDDECQQSTRRKRIQMLLSTTCVATEKVAPVELFSTKRQKKGQFRVDNLPIGTYLGRWVLLTTQVLLLNGQLYRQTAAMIELLLKCNFSNWSNL